MKKFYDKNKVLLPIILNKNYIIGAIGLICMVIISYIYVSPYRPKLMSSVFDYMIKPGTINGATNFGVFSNFMLPASGFLLVKLLEIYEKDFIVHRYSNKKEIWNTEVKNIIIISIVIMLIIVTLSYICSVIKFGSFHNAWPEAGSTLDSEARGLKLYISERKVLYSTGSMLLLIFLSGTLGLITQGLLVLILKIKIKTSFLVYFCMLIITFVDCYLLGGELIIKRMILGGIKMLYIGEIFGDIIYLIAVSTTIYFIGRRMNCKKEFYK